MGLRRSGGRTPLLGSMSGTGARRGGCLATEAGGGRRQACAATLGRLYGATPSSALPAKSAGRRHHVRQATKREVSSGMHRQNRPHPGQLKACGTRQLLPRAGQAPGQEVPQQVACQQTSMRRWVPLPSASRCGQAPRRRPRPPPTAPPAAHQCTAGAAGSPCQPGPPAAGGAPRSPPRPAQHRCRPPPAQRQAPASRACPPLLAPPPGWRPAHRCPGPRRHCVARQSCPNVC